MTSVVQYNRLHPFSSKIKQRYLLNQPGSRKATYHIVLDLEGSELSYRPGDCVGVYACNRKDVVQKTLHALDASGDEDVTWRGEKLKLREVLLRRANLARVGKGLVQKIVEKVSKKDLEELLLPEKKGALKRYLESFELWDFLEEHRDAGLSIEEVLPSLGLLLPRLYSIASSQSVVGNEVHLTVAWLNYQTRGLERYGVATDFLCKDMEVDDVLIPIYIQATKDFLLPEEDCPVILIGPGTGVAPFRGFLQERVARGTKAKHWLFFGEWNQEYDFFYEDEWKLWESQGVLRISTAFSRDQEHKIYVQDRMLENSEELWKWLCEGAVVYVCGDAQRMAKDVDAALHQIVQEQGAMGEEEAKAFVKGLREEKRYLRDVY